MMARHLLHLTLLLGCTFLLAEGYLGKACTDYGVQDISTCDVTNSYCGPLGKCACLEGYTANGETACESYFNCLNDGCKNGAKCASATGQCQCEMNQAGFDCGIDTSGDATPDLTTSGCELCNKTGTFMCSPGTTTCHCKYGYTGNTCSEPRVVIEVCDKDSMKVKITPYYSKESFGGLIYVQGKKDDPNCGITEDGGVYSTPDFPFADCARKEEINGDVYQTVDIVVQSKQDYLTSHNIIHQAKCISLAIGNLITEHKTAADPLGDLNKGSGAADREGAVGMVIEGATVNGSPNTYQLGTELTVKFTLLNTDAFQAFKVKTMSTGSSDGKHVKELILGRCPAPDAEDVMAPNSIDVSMYDEADIANNNVIQVKFYAHKFLGSDGVRVTGEVEACVNKTDCASELKCDPHTRRRRTTGEKENEFTLEKKITVIDRKHIDNGFGTEGSQSGNVMTSQCRSSPEYISTVTILGGLLGLTYFFQIIICLCMRRRRREKQRNTDTEAETLEYKKNDMKIPRINFRQKYESSMTNSSYE